jgi:hypothetical protein
VFRTSVNVGVDVTAAQMKSASTPSFWPRRRLPRDCRPGRELTGIHFAMEY